MNKLKAATNSFLHEFWVHKSTFFMRQVYQESSDYIRMTKAASAPKPKRLSL